MPAVRSQLVRLRSERGSFSLPELLVGTAMLIAVFSATMFLIPGAIRQSGTGQDRTFGALAIRSAAEQMTRELRAATSLEISATEVTFNTYERTVRFSCSGASGSASCVRAEAPLGQEPEGSETLADRLLSASVFCVRSQDVGRQYVEVNLSAPPSDEREAVYLGAAATLRNTSAVTATTPVCS